MQILHIYFSDPEKSTKFETFSNQTENFTEMELYVVPRYYVEARVIKALFVTLLHRD